MDNCFYKFHEAREKAKEGDELYLKIKLKNSAEIETRIKVDTKNTDVFALSWEQYDSEQWQVIPAKKEMVSAGSFINSTTFPAPPPNQYSAYHANLIKCFKEGGRNRDILYVDLMELMENWRKYSLPDFAKRLHDAINKINSILNPTATPE